MDQHDFPNFLLKNEIQEIGNLLNDKSLIVLDNLGDHHSTNVAEVNNLIQVSSVISLNRSIMSGIKYYYRKKWEFINSDHCFITNTGLKNHCEAYLQAEALILYLKHLQSIHSEKNTPPPTKEIEKNEVLPTEYTPKKKKPKLRSKGNFTGHLTREQAEYFYKELISIEDKTIDKSTQKEHFIAGFVENSKIPHPNSTRWIGDNLLLAFTLDYMYACGLGSKYWQVNNERCKFFIHEDGKHITRSALCSAKRDYQNNVNPEGHLSIQRIIDQMKNM